MLKIGKGDYIPEELTDIRVLQVLYIERGLTFQCNDGRISEKGEESHA